MDCVEIYEPYIEKYELRRKYREVFNLNVLDLTIDHYDYMILGDVLEHLKREDAIDLLNRINEKKIKCLIAVPYNTEQGEYDGNIYETHHQPDLNPAVISQRYPSLNLLYGDNTYGHYINYVPKDYPVLFLSTGRRMECFRKTLKSLVDHNPGISNKFKRVWLLDDRSSFQDRMEMEIMLKTIFGGKYSMVTFNSDEPFFWVEKFNFIRKVTNPTDYVFFLEDDWESTKGLDINYHLTHLEKNPDIVQVSMADPFWIQPDFVKLQNTESEMYWTNPWPDSFRHPWKNENGVYVWSEVHFNNFTNTPSLTKASVFHSREFRLVKSFEAEFADSVNGKFGKQIFTKMSAFDHFGSDHSLINNL